MASESKALFYDEDTETLLNRLLVKENDPDTPSTESPFKVIVPEPGFCVKLKTEDGNKTFVNVCHSPNVPAPKDITDDELIKLLESDDPYGFRIPMSVGEGHAEVDKNNHGCTVYDIIVNPEFFKKVTTSELFRTFFLTVSIEGLESKYNVTLKRDWIVLKNKKFMGSLTQQNVRTTSKPLIQEVGSDDFHQQHSAPEIPHSKASVLTAPKPKGAVPKYAITPEPDTGHPDYLVAEIQLPLVKSSDSLALDVGEDRLLLTTRSDVYQLDIYLPYTFIQPQTVAQFNRKTKVLTITLSVSPESS